MELLSIPLSNVEIVSLLIICFIGATITTSVGAGGGVFVIAGMSMILPAITLLPVHAATQAGTGLIRAFLFIKSLQVRIFLLFMVGSVIGYALSIHFLIALPEFMMKLILGFGIAILVLLPELKIQKVSTTMLIIFGAVTGFLTMFIGVMGPVIIMFLSTFLKQRHIIVGTLAWCISFQNLGKAFVFTYVGFDFMPWALLILLLLAVSSLGVYVGKKLLDKSNDVLFKKILKIVILLLAAKLIIDGLLLIKA